MVSPDDPDHRDADPPLEAAGAVSASIPAMPVVPSSELYRGSPHLLVQFGQRHSIGWQDARKSGSCFVVVRISVLDSVKVLERFPLTEDGWAQAWRALAKLDKNAAKAVVTSLAARAARQHSRAEITETAEQMRERERKRKQERNLQRVARLNTTTALQWLGVIVRGDHVYKYSLSAEWGGEGGPSLGELAGAHAEVTGGRAGHRRSGGARAADTVVATSLLGPVGLLAGASRRGTQGTAFVVFANGTLYEKRIADAASLVRAQADAVRFNALAASSGQSQTRATVPAALADADTAKADQPVLERIHDMTEQFATGESASADGGESPPEARGSSHLADDLERLASLHASGALTDAEFQAAKIQLLGT
jgi:hypothetical protein